MLQLYFRNEKDIKKERFLRFQNNYYPDDFISVVDFVERSCKLAVEWGFPTISSKKEFDEYE